MIPLIVITHGKICEELINTAESILGRQEHIYPIGITVSDSIENVRRKLESLVGKLASGKDYDGALVLTDMLGGSSCNICIPLIEKYKMTIISGVNLYMLLSAIKNRQDMGIEELKNKVSTDAVRSIADVCSVFKTR